MALYLPSSRERGKRPAILSGIRVFPVFGRRWGKGDPERPSGYLSLRATPPWPEQVPL
jgi:hypothetical protein